MGEYGEREEGDEKGKKGRDREATPLDTKSWIKHWHWPSLSLLDYTYTKTPPKVVIWPKTNKIQPSVLISQAVISELNILILECLLPFRIVGLQCVAYKSVRVSVGNYCVI